MQINSSRPAASAAAKIEDIEFLRAVAIGLVLIAHQPALLGWHGVDLAEIQKHLVLGSGVDLFLAISGFVICRSFIARSDGHIPSDFRATAFPFWIRRVYRILPAAWFWIAASIFGTVFFNHGGHFGKLSSNLWDGFTAVLQLSNISLAACGAKVLSWCADGGIPNGIYWSLSLEEQFYLLFPVILIFTPRWLLVPFLVVLTVIFILIPKVEWTWYLRFEGLLIGVLLGLASFHPLYARLRPTILERSWFKLIAMIVLLLLVLLVPSPALDLVPFRVGLVSVVCGVWVFIASHGLALPASPVSPFLLWMGSRSYSLYLCHFIAFCTAREIFFLEGREGTSAEANARYLGLGILLLVLYAELSYRLIERPFIRRGALAADGVVRFRVPFSRNSTMACCATTARLRPHRNSGTVRRICAACQVKAAMTWGWWIYRR